MTDEPGILDTLYLEAEHFDLIARSRPLEPRTRVVPLGVPRTPFPIDGPLCSCCSHIWRDRGNGRREPDRRPAVACWNHGASGNTSLLCRTCLDSWFDNADDDPDLEPASWVWLSGARPRRLEPA